MFFVILLKFNGYCPMDIESEYGIGKKERRKLIQSPNGLGTGDKKIR